jgi:hypothetical protein
MDAADLWMDAYQGEVLGEALFGWLAEREEDPVHRHQLTVLTRLEQSTRALAEPVFDRRGYDRGDAAVSAAAGVELAQGVVAIPWEEFMAGIVPVAVDFLVKYHRMAELADDPDDRAVAEAYIAHEEALATFARRAAGQESGDPLEQLLELPHLAAALAG